MYFTFSEPMCIFLSTWLPFIYKALSALKVSEATKVIWSQLICYNETEKTKKST